MVGGVRENMDSFVIFVVSLGGSTVQVRVEGNDLYEILAAKVVAKVNTPVCHWYLTNSGKDLRHLPCPTSVLHRDSTVRMQSRLLGGAPLQENGSVQHLIEEDAGLPVVLVSVAWHRGRRRVPQRERRALGREPQRSSSQCPTERRPPGASNAAGGPDSRSPSPDSNRRQPQPSVNRTDAASVNELLKGLNVPAENSGSDIMQAQPSSSRTQAGKASP